MPKVNGKDTGTSTAQKMKFSIKDFFEILYGKLYFLCSEVRTICSK